MHVAIFGIYFLIGWVVGGDVARLFYWWRRARIADRELDKVLRRVG